MTEIADLIEVAVSLRALLVAVYEGEVTSTPAGRHWLAGAIAALNVSGQPPAQQPHLPSDAVSYCNSQR